MKQQGSIWRAERGTLTDCGDAQLLRRLEVGSNVVEEHHLARLDLEQVECVLVEFRVGFPVAARERAGNKPEEECVSVRSWSC